jgi:hypothetical protein
MQVLNDQASLTELLESIEEKLPAEGDSRLPDNRSDEEKKLVKELREKLKALN